MKISRKRKRWFLLFAFIIISLLITTYSNQQKKETEFPPILYGIPTYSNSRLSPQLTNTGNPYIFVFLSPDKLDQVVSFYESQLKMKVKKIEYAHKWLVIYQFNLEKKGEQIGIRNLIMRGVEVIALNSMYRKIYSARTKIKIILPAIEIQKAELKEKNTKDQK